MVHSSHQSYGWKGGCTLVLVAGTFPTSDSRGCFKGGRYIFPIGMGMSELKISHWIFHVPPDFFDTFIHLP